ncbi:hypothetical protein SS50377_22874 [Spironucleus salmonicida]|uniref:Uncharacterized protein n=1 Tax=Spironucleus salmonicida TaxID=348837 RepID=V6LYE2_9EUKA|nr:hypothetical protein SS50377_22874 [Spironucleus salmonicida]|eukprot:EST48726.1 Hypothetical protein SS50377_11043 [Spironucleus salmonicida]
MFNPAEFSQLFSQSMSDSAMKQKLTPDEASRFEKAFEKPEFQEIFAEFAKEMQSETSRKDFEKQLSEAEAMAAAQQVVEEVQNPPKPVKFADKTPKTASGKVALRKTQKGTKAALERAERERTEEQLLLQRARGLESVYESIAQKGPAEDFSKLDHLVAEVEQMKRDFGAGEELESVLSYVQNTDYADYMQDERVNIQEIRGADKVKLEVGIPAEIDPKSVKLEVQERFIKVTVGDRVLQKDIAQAMNAKQVVAKMVKNPKFKDAQVLQIVVPIVKDKNAIFSDFSKQITPERHYESKPVDVVENEIEKLVEKMAEKPVISANAPEIAQAASGWGVQKVERPQKPVQKVDTSLTFEQLLKEKMKTEKQREIASAQNLEEGLEVLPPSGVAFSFRGQVLNFCNPDLADCFE